VPWLTTLTSVLLQGRQVGSRGGGDARVSKRTVSAMSDMLTAAISSVITQGMVLSAVGCAAASYLIVHAFVMGCCLRSPVGWPTCVVYHQAIHGCCLGAVLDSIEQLD